MLLAAWLSIFLPCVETFADDFEVTLTSALNVGVLPLVAHIGGVRPAGSSVIRAEEICGQDTRTNSADSPVDPKTRALTCCLLIKFPKARDPVQATGFLVAENFV